MSTTMLRTVCYLVRRSLYYAIPFLTLSTAPLGAQWSDLPDLGPLRTLTQQTILDGKLYVFGGMDLWGEVKVTATVLDLDDTAAGWMGGVPGLHESRAIGYATTINGRVFVVGGMGYDPGVGAVGRRSVIELHPEIEDWVVRGNLARGVWNAAYATLGTRIYVIGGGAMVDGHFTPGTATQIFDVATNTVSAGPSLPDSIYSGNAAAVGNDIYLFAGYQRIDGRGGYNRHVYRLANGSTSWERLADTIPYPVGTGAAGVFDGRIYVVGGFGAPFTTQVFDPETGRWSTSFPLTSETMGTYYMPADSNALYLVGSERGAVRKLTLRTPAGSGPIAHATPLLDLRTVPHPMIGSGRIEFNVSLPGRVRLDLRDVRGDKVVSLFDGPCGQGPQSVYADVTALRGGVYTLLLSTPAGVLARSFVVIN
jgi:hypothetical protein